VERITIVIVNRCYITLVKIIRTAFVKKSFDTHQGTSLTTTGESASGARDFLRHSLQVPNRFEKNVRQRRAGEGAGSSLPRCIDVIWAKTTKTTMIRGAVLAHSGSVRVPAYRTCTTGNLRKQNLSLRITTETVIEGVVFALV
jgi:hypothetical protein